MIGSFKLRLSIILSTLFTLSCSDEKSESAQEASGRIGETEFVLKDSPNLSFDGASLTGTGSAIAKLPADELAGERNFKMSFTLNDGGSVELIAFSNNALTEGVGVKFTRSANALKVELNEKEETLDISSAFSELSGESTVSIHFDVHNGETPAHVIGWTTSTDNPDGSNSKFDSERDEDTFGAFAGKGAGTFWGLKLNAAKVTEAESRGAKFDDED